MSQDTVGRAANPLSPPAQPADQPAEQALEPSPVLGTQVVAQHGPTSPIGVEQPDSAPRLPFTSVRADPPVWVVGLHGGSGATTVRALVGQAAELPASWPARAEPGQAVPRALLVARTHSYGLTRAAEAARQWASGGMGLLLVGLVLVNDAPTVPKVLTQQAQQVSGMVPAVWHVPWLEQLRTSSDPPEADQLSRRVRKTLTSIGAHIEHARSAGTLTNLQSRDTTDSSIPTQQGGTA